MDRSRRMAWLLHGLWTLGLIGASFGLGYLVKPGAPDWGRWLLLAACLGTLGIAAATAADGARPTLGRLAVKTALWPAVAAGLAGAARLAGIELYARLEPLAVTALAAAHVLGEWIARPKNASPAATEGPPHPAARCRLAAWLLDLQWLLTLTGAAWSWRLLSDRRLELLLAAGALFLWLVRPGTTATRRPAAEMKPPLHADDRR